MNEPATAEGRAAVEAIKGGALGLFADEPSDPIAGMVRQVEVAAASAEQARIRTELDEARERIADDDHSDDYKTGWLDALETIVGELAAKLPEDDVRACTTTHARGATHYHLTRWSERFPKK